MAWVGGCIAGSLGRGGTAYGVCDAIKLPLPNMLPHNKHMDAVVQKGEKLVNIKMS